MSFRLRIKYFLVHTLNYTSKNANKIIASGALSINGKKIVQNELVKDEDEVLLNSEVIKKGLQFSYYALNKPRGIESTFNDSIKDNLKTVFPLDNSYFIAGRLDKASEGLLLVSNDGKWVHKITRPESRKEKEYVVEVDKVITDDFVKKMQGGLDIGICVTQACEVKRMNATQFTIVLTEGKNKQIRRMCKKLGYKVMALKRVRIDQFYLNDLQDVNMRALQI